MEESIFDVFFGIPEWFGAPLITALGGFSFLAVLCVFFWRRAGSSYGVLSRLYAILIGGTEFHSNHLNNFWYERKDVERFNALFNTQAKSLKDVQRFVSWIKKYELDFQQFTRLRCWFDFKRRKVKKVNAWQLIAPFILMLIVSPTATVTTVVAMPSAALIKFKDGKQWFWLDYAEAKSFRFNPFRNRGDDWRFGEAACSEPEFDAEKIAEITQLRQERVNTLCESFNNADTAKYIDGVVAQQKLLWPLAVFLWLFTLYLIVDVFRRIKAIDARRHLYENLRKRKLSRCRAELS